MSQDCPRVEYLNIFLTAKDEMLKFGVAFDILKYIFL
jgi:hypothetical protein